ncbi:hypothetical protein E0Z10_g10663 [Xylaria hypoxylon]|uniref:Rhodopsin domain-containing protein n=1 Tax=Xylaria hypoxylon TaxID=37992 RepID=A0A4Z0YCD4_9PEZI|nr:hypothetical protein E0Z10_g10663 [Xylaria hypoxylon]
MGLPPSAIEAWSYLSIGLVVTALRTYFRVNHVGFQKLQADDYLVWVAAIFYVAETTAAYSVGAVAHGFANNGLSDQARQSLSPDNPEYHLRVIGSKIQLVGWATYSVLLWTLKASLLCFYIRLVSGLPRNYYNLIYIGFFLLIASFVGLIGTIFLECRPFHHNWQINPDPGDACYPASSVRLLIVALTLNVSTDIYLIAIPVSLLWNSALKITKRLGLVVLFSGSVFIIFCAVFRTVLMIKDPVNGAQTAGSWSVRETFVATITSNLPVVFPLFRSWFRPVIDALSNSVSSIKKTSRASSRDIYTFGRSPRNIGPRGVVPTANPITDISFNESEERMVGKIAMQPLETSDGITMGQQTGIMDDRIRKDVEISISSETLSSQNGTPPQRNNMFPNYNL